MILSTLYLGILALFGVSLAILVIKARRSHGVALGDNNHTQLYRRIRAHGNFMEYTPLFCLMLFMTEFLASTAFIHYISQLVFALHVVAILFLLGESCMRIACSFTSNMTILAN